MRAATPASSCRKAEDPDPAAAGQRGDGGQGNRDLAERHRERKDMVLSMSSADDLSFSSALFSMPFGFGLNSFLLTGIARHFRPVFRGLRANRAAEAERSSRKRPL